MPPDVNLNFSCDGIINVRPIEKLKISAEIKKKGCITVLVLSETINEDTTTGLG